MVRVHAARWCAPSPSLYPSPLFLGVLVGDECLSSLHPSLQSRPAPRAPLIDNRSAIHWITMQTPLTRSLPPSHPLLRLRYLIRFCCNYEQAHRRSSSFPSPHYSPLLPHCYFLNSNSYVRKFTIYVICTKLCTITSPPSSPSPSPNHHTSSSSSSSIMVDREVVQWWWYSGDADGDDAVATILIVDT